MQNETNNFLEQTLLSNQPEKIHLSLSELGLKNSLKVSKFPS